MEPAAHTGKESLLSQKEYKKYKYRFVVSVLFALSSALNAIMWICYSSVLETLTTIYDESLSYVNFGTSLIWLLTYIPMNFVANYILDEYGLKSGIVVGNLCVITGLWIRTFCKNGFVFIFIGQTIGSLGQPFILNSPQKVSAIWYPPEERTLSTALLSVANPVGVGIGFALTQFFVSDNPSPAQGLIQIYNLSFFHAILGTCILIPATLLFRNKPPTPPSKGAETEKYDYTHSLKALMKNKNYLRFLISAGSFWGAFNVMAIVLQPLISPFGFSSSEAGSYGGLSLLAGLLGSIALGAYVSTTREFKKNILRCQYISLGSMVLLVVLAFIGNPWLFGAGVVVFGFFTTALLPLFFEICVEISFPVNEATAGGFFIMGTQVTAIIVSEAVDFILEIDSGNDNLARMLSVICMALVVLLEYGGTLAFIGVREDMRRTRYEKTGIMHGIDGKLSVESSEADDSTKDNHVKHEGDVVKNT